ncbi:hypothetical protein [Streptomyces sp. NPDC053427]|uniref:hypothetical protein n=1 Tax=Streptomyces sp. NPDC053427 TaxID=3365701 RepID=UPI0037D58D1A
MPSARHPGGRLDFAYDAAGRENERSIGERHNLAGAWDAEHRLTGQILRSEQSVLQRRDYTYRADGALTGVEDQLLSSRFERPHGNKSACARRY